MNGELSNLRLKLNLLAGNGMATQIRPLLPQVKVLWLDVLLKERRYETVSLDKAIEHKKEKRRQYRDSRRFAPGCRNHGTCDWCVGNRKYKFRDKKPPEKED